MGVSSSSIRYVQPPNVVAEVGERKMSDFVDAWNDQVLLAINSTILPLQARVFNSVEPVHEAMDKMWSHLVRPRGMAFSHEWRTSLIVQGAPHCTRLPGDN